MGFIFPKLQGLYRISEGENAELNEPPDLWVHLNGAFQEKDNFFCPVLLCAYGQFKCNPTYCYYKLEIKLYLS